MAKKPGQKLDAELEAAIRTKKPAKFPIWGWVIIAVVVAAGLFGLVKSTRELTTCPYETNALVTLRALSNIELAYRDYNEDHRYATLSGLKQSNFVKFGHTENTLIPGYRVEVVPLSFYNDNVHSFVIRIFPTNPSRPCGTFQMGPDRKLMEFLPQVNNNIHEKANWVNANYVLDMLPPRERLEWMGDNYAYN